MVDLTKLRVAIVHYWFMSRRGGERVVEALAEMFPQADIYTLVANPAALAPHIKDRVQRSFLQKIPGVLQNHRLFLPLYPLALEQFDLREYDLVISSESGPAKGVITGTNTCHICYCHTPMRYLWDMYHDYLSEPGLGKLKKLIFALSTHYVRQWDVASASRVDYFVCNSHNVARRIRKHYRRQSEVVYPPAAIPEARIRHDISDYYLVVGQLAAYKRADLAIEACVKLGRKLRVIGEGEQKSWLRSIAGPGIEFLSGLSDAEVREQYSRCRALLFPGEEDFGIVPVEAQSFGRPVIAFAAGGALETVIGCDPGSTFDPRCTGVFFREPKVESVVEAMRYFESNEARFDPELIQAHSRRFDPAEFKRRMEALIREHLADFRRSDLEGEYLEKAGQAAR